MHRMLLYLRFAWFVFFLHPSESVVEPVGQSYKPAGSEASAIAIDLSRKSQRMKFTL